MTRQRNLPQYRGMHEDVLRTMVVRPNVAARREIAQYTVKQSYKRQRGPRRSLKTETASRRWRTTHPLIPHLPPHTEMTTTITAAAAVANLNA